MDFDLPSDRGRTVAVPPAMALAVATIVAAGVTGLAVAGLTWTLDRPADRATGAPPDVTSYSQSPAPGATTPIDTPGYDEALGLLAPVPVPTGATSVEGVGVAVAPTGPPAQEETVRRTAAARRPVVGPTASVRSTPTAAAAPAPTAAATPAPEVPAAPVTDDPATLAPDTADFTEPEPVVEPTETAAPPQRRWEQPRRTWRDEPRRDPAPAPQWGGPFGGVPRMFPWG